MLWCVVCVCVLCCVVLCCVELCCVASYRFGMPWDNTKCSLACCCVVLCVELVLSCDKISSVVSYAELSCFVLNHFELFCIELY